MTDVRERITLTLFPVKSKTANAAVIAVWECMIDDWHVKIENQDETKDARRQGTCRTVEVVNWHHNHPELLRLSKMSDQLVFEAVTQRCELKEQYKIFYHNGMTQFCDTLADKFNTKKLI